MTSASLPEDPRLAGVARELEKTRGAAMLCDSNWTLVWVSEDLKALIGESDPQKLGYGKHIVACYISETWARRITAESQARSFFNEFPLFMHDTPGGKAGLFEIVRTALKQFPDAMSEWADPSIDRDQIVEVLFGAIEPQEPATVWMNQFDFLQEGLPPTPINGLHIRLHDHDGEFIGTAVLYDPGLPARVLSLVARGDEGMFSRMAQLVEPGRHKAAILFADLQDSTAISRRLPSAAYFRLIRAMTTAIDEVVVSRDGIVGKHAGDGVTAFFLRQDLGSASKSARAAIEAARAVAEAAATAAKQVGDETGLIQPESTFMNVAVHWGGTLYMGQLVTGGRLEVTALGDAVNECARIQETARDGEALVSKSLIEQLEVEDARALGIDPDGVVYRAISELPGATEKALRDAGSIPVTVL
ncbi:MAG TPA: adenylate/guanylate cyclase domain-containing protein [Actinomycetota bacterium]|nr:adenylate/guanylate cyclase domain-containing protein [Actinomycetota bacterium]